MHETAPPKLPTPPLNRVWSHAVSLDTMPVCPECGTPLQPAVTVFWHGVAFCDSCARGPVGAIRFCLFMMYHSLLRRHLSVRGGLTFWTPRSHGPLQILDRYEFELNNPPGRPDHIVVPEILDGTRGDDLMDYAPKTLPEIWALLEEVAQTARDHNPHP